jgi:hypothetical protein
MNALRAFWRNHVQKSLSSVLIVISSADLGALSFYQQDLAHFIGSKWAAHALAAARLLCGSVIFIRAVQAKKAP